MSLFSKLYTWTMRLSRHPHAPWFLGLLSFSESSFFPIPPDVMLAPMCLAQPKKAFGFGLITSIASVLGGVLGYVIGAFAFDLIHPFLENSHYWDAYEMAVMWFKEWGFWAIFLAGFSPIPYKVFTIAAGVMSMAFAPFVLASMIGRGTRFFLVAGLMAWGGARMEVLLARYIDYIGWALVSIVCLGILYLQL